MQATVVTPMLALFRSDETSYQPVHPSGPLALEDGNPQASLGNLKRLELVIQDIWVRKGLSRALIQFSTGEQYLAFGLRDPAALAHVAAEAGYGEYHDLKGFYECLPPEYDDKLPAASEPRHGCQDQTSATFRFQATRTAGTRRLTLPPAIPPLVLMPSGRTACKPSSGDGFAALPKKSFTKW